MEKFPRDGLLKSFEALMKIVECPVCYEKMQSADAQCVNRHLVCSKCRVSLESCPVCRGEFSPERPSGLLQQVIEVLPRWCKYEGCETYLYNDNEHEIYCNFRVTSCLAEECKWGGLRSELFDHVREVHPTIVNNNGMNTVFQGFDLTEDQKHMRAYTVEGHFFWLCISYSPELGFLKHEFTFIPNGKPNHDLYVKISYSSAKTKFTVQFKLIPEETISKYFETDENDETDEVNDVNSFDIPNHMLKDFVDKYNNLIANVYIKAK